MAKLITKKEKRKATINKSNRKTNSLSNKLKSAVSNVKGKYFTGLFQCYICGHTHTRGYLCSIGDDEYEICTDCKKGMASGSGYLKLIYTPTGNNQ